MATKSRNVKINTIAGLVFGLLVVFFSPSQAVAQCDVLSQGACAVEAQKQGLQLGGGGYSFAGKFGTKGCYSYTSGEYKGMAFYSNGEIQSAIEIAPPSQRYRVNTTGFCNGSESEQPITEAQKKYRDEGPNWQMHLDAQCNMARFPQC